MEADYGSASQLACTGRRNARLVRHTLEDRDVPQDPEAGVQGRGSTATYDRPAGQPDLRTLYPELAHLLAHDDRPRSSARPARSVTHANGNRLTGSPSTAIRAHRTCATARAQCVQTRPARRLSGSCQRPSSWQYGDVTRHEKVDRHSTRLRTRNEKSGQLQGSPNAYAADSSSDDDSI